MKLNELGVYHFANRHEVKALFGLSYKKQSVGDQEKNMDFKMNKKILAIAIAATTTFGAQAFELYNEDGTTFSISGHVSANLNGGDKIVVKGKEVDKKTEVGTTSSRINMTATQELDNGFTVDARGEWALNFLNGGENSFTTRLGYMGLTHEDLGRAVVGTQWAPYYDVASVTDMPIAFANGFLYSGVEGAGFTKTGQTRADKMVSYRNGVELGDAGSIGFGAGWQGAEHPTGQRAQIALTYSVAGAQLGYAYNTGTVSGDDVTFNVLSAKYGSYGNGLYVAGIYQMTEEKNLDTDSYEVVAAYALPSSLNFSINYEVVEADAKGVRSVTETEVMAINAEYNFAPNVVGYTGYQFDLNDNSNTDAWALGARIYL